MRLDQALDEQRRQWEKAGVVVPSWDHAAVCQKTWEEPIWVHLGGGNIFRGYVADLQQRLLDSKESNRGILAAELFDPEIVQKIYRPNRNLTLQIKLDKRGNASRKIIASVAGCIAVENREAWEKLLHIFRSQTLQMVTFTITEKGYVIGGLDGELLPDLQKDLRAGPDFPQHGMARLCALLWARYSAGAPPLACVSLDNCSHNGERLQQAQQYIAQQWVDRGLVESGFLDYLTDSQRVSFPWSMIDKITPRPDETIAHSLLQEGIEGMEVIRTQKGTYMAPFVNLETAEYLVLEDSFPAGRPPLERAGVLMGDRANVERAENMKVSACLNPLHTALAVFGCLLGKPTIAEAIADPQLKHLVEEIGYQEGLPMVEPPQGLDPRKFLDEVLQERFPNPNIPDMPQRIATDISQKLAVRFGHTILASLRQQKTAGDLWGICLVLAGWLRYLLAVDDRGNDMVLSPDPLLPQLQQNLQGIALGDHTLPAGRLDVIWRQERLFGVDLCAAGLSDLLTAMFCSMIQGPGAVRQTLAMNWGNRQ